MTSPLKSIAVLKHSMQFVQRNLGFEGTVVISLGGSYGWVSDNPEVGAIS